MKPAIVAGLERLVRALVRPFTESRLAHEARLERTVISAFLHLEDEELGTRRYTIPGGQVAGGARIVYIFPNATASASDLAPLAKKLRSALADWEVVIGLPL